MKTTIRIMPLSDLSVRQLCLKILLWSSLVVVSLGDDDVPSGQTKTELLILGIPILAISTSTSTLTSTSTSTSTITVTETIEHEPLPVTVTPEHTFLGCYSKSREHGGHIFGPEEYVMPYDGHSLDKVTIEDCLRACASAAPPDKHIKAYTYAGLRRNGRNCICGLHIDKDAHKLPSNACLTTYSGDHSQTRGGHDNIIAIYKLASADNEPVHTSTSRATSTSTSTSAITTAVAGPTGRDEAAISVTPQPAAANDDVTRQHVPSSSKPGVTIAAIAASLGGAILLTIGLFLYWRSHQRYLARLRGGGGGGGAHPPAVGRQRAAAPEPILTTGAMASNKRDDDRAALAFIPPTTPALEKGSGGGGGGGGGHPQVSARRDRVAGTGVGAGVGGESSAVQWRNNNPDGVVSPVTPRGGGGGGGPLYSSAWDDNEQHAWNNTRRKVTRPYPAPVLVAPFSQQQQQEQRPPSTISTSGIGIAIGTPPPPPDTAITSSARVPVNMVRRGPSIGLSQPTGPSLPPGPSLPRPGERTRPPFPGIAIAPSSSGTGAGSGGQRQQRVVRLPPPRRPRRSFDARAFETGIEEEEEEEEEEEDDDGGVGKGKGTSPISRDSEAADVGSNRGGRGSDGGLLGMSNANASVPSLGRYGSLSRRARRAQQKAESPVLGWHSPWGGGEGEVMRRERGDSQRGRGRDNLAGRRQQQRGAPVLPPIAPGERFDHRRWRGTIYTQPYEAHGREMLRGMRGGQQLEEDGEFSPVSMLYSPRAFDRRL